MKYNILFSTLFIFVISSCSKNSTSPKDESITTQWGGFSINQVYYDSLYIESHNCIKISDKSVDKIILFVEDNDSFIPQDSLIPYYVSNGDYYYLNFQFIQKVIKEKLHFNFRLQYRLIDESLVEIDSTHLMIHYPYESSQVFIIADEVYSEMKIHFQDIDLNENILFFHPTSALGLYEYKFSSQQTKELVDYCAGDYIAHDSNYVFWDYARYRIFRYNLESDTTDFEIDLSHLSYTRISGLECWQGQLYVLFWAANENYIGIFDYNGNYISSIPYYRNTFFLTIKDDIAYSHDYEKTISCFDLTTKIFLDDKILPTDECEGIRIFEDKFYFADWKKRIIGFLPLSDLN